MRLIIMLSLMFTAVLTAHAALPKPRPQTGTGIAIMRLGVAPERDTIGTVILYREPWIGRIAEKPAATLPLLSQVVRTRRGEYAAAVLGKRGAWLKIAYDEAGREGWLKMGRKWDYFPWDDFLPGRIVRLLPGLNKTYGSVRREPSPYAEEIRPFSQGETTRAEAVEGDWLHIPTGSPDGGWLRWRDGDGHFLVSLPNE